MFNHLFFICIFLGISSFANPPNVRTDLEKSTSQFNARFFVTTERATVNRWDGPDAHYEESSTKIVRKKQRFYPLVTFKNGEKSSSGKVYIKYKIMITRPDGKLFLEDEIQAWQGHPRHDGRELSRDFLSIYFGPNDLLGKYHIYVIVFDVIGKTEVRLESTVTCIP